MTKEQTKYKTYQEWVEYGKTQGFFQDRIENPFKTQVEQTNSWEDEFEKLTPEPDWSKYEYDELSDWLKNNPNLYDGEMYSEPTWTLDKAKIKNFISKTISQEKEKWVNSIKNHKFTLYSARKALVDGNFVLPEEKTIDVFDYNELLDLLDK